MENKDIEKELCEAVMYYMFAFDKIKLEDWLEILNYSKNEFGKLLSGFRDDHPAVIYYNMLINLNDEQYKNISEKVKEKINIFYARKNKYITIESVASEEEADILAEIIIDSSEYKTIDEYYSKKLEIEEDKRILYAVGLVMYDGIGHKKDIQTGLKFLKTSAEKGYSYAMHKLNEISQEQ